VSGPVTVDESIRWPQDLTQLGPVIRLLAKGFGDPAIPADETDPQT
jgi:hypothetical protein